MRDQLALEAGQSQSRCELYKLPLFTKRSVNTS
jgi:hypothetical protein